MSFVSGHYVDLYTVRKNEYGVTGKIHAFHKDGDKVYTDFSGYVRLKGNAAKKALELGLPEVQPKVNAPRKRIKLTFGPSVTNRYIGEEKKNALVGAARGNEMLIKFIDQNASPISVDVIDFEVQEDTPSYNNKASGNSSGGYNSKSKSTAPQYAPADNDDAQLPF